MKQITYEEALDLLIKINATVFYGGRDNEETKITWSNGQTTITYSKEELIKFALAVDNGVRSFLASLS